AGEPGWRVVFYLSATGVAMSSVWATLTGWHTLSFPSAVYLSGIGVSALIAQLSMTRAYKVGDKFTVASLSYMTVVFSALSAAFFLGEELFWQEILGMCIIILSGILSSIRPIAFKQRLQALFRQR
ncbi:EamA family transporter, partial [Neisseria gonorrhoeae]